MPVKNLTYKQSSEGLRRLAELYGELERTHSEQEIADAEAKVKQPRQGGPQQPLPLVVYA